MGWNMNSRGIKADNSFLENKIALRIAHLPAGDLCVLDCFSGEGKIWREIKEREKMRDINVVSIEKKTIDRLVLQGDNRKLMGTLLLTGKFNIVDLDAYGSPFPQMEIMFDAIKKSGMREDAHVFFTFIQSFQGSLHKKMLELIGYAPSMIKKIPTLFARNGFDKFCGYLALRGVRKITYRSYCKNVIRKFYGYFSIKSLDKMG